MVVTVVVTIVVTLVRSPGHRGVKLVIKRHHLPSFLLVSLLVFYIEVSVYEKGEKETLMVFSCESVISFFSTFNLSLSSLFFCNSSLGCLFSFYFFSQGCHCSNSSRSGYRFFLSFSISSSSVGMSILLIQ